MSAITECRKACRTARNQIEHAQAYSPTAATGNRLVHIHKKMDELISILGDLRRKEAWEESAGISNDQV